MSMGQPIGEVVIAGSGIAGWSAAAMFRARLPHLRVTVVGEPTPDALADRVAATLPSIGGFHGDIGLDEGQFFQGTGASFRLGSLFEGWNADRAPYVHAYGETGQAFGSVSFHHHWLRAARQGRAAPFEAHSPAAALGRAGRFVHPQGLVESPLAGFEYGVVVDPAHYRMLMRAYALHLGAAERPGAIAGVRLDGESGAIAELALADGGAISGDLYLDCTGPAAQLRSAMDGGFEDWSRWLPCDRVLFAEGPGSGDPPLLDRVVAHGAGWRWESASRAASAHGLAYSSAHLSDDRAGRVLRAGANLDPSGTALRIRAGRRVDPWLRNCVAVGDAAVSVEPLEFTNLHLAHSAIDRIVAKLPDCDFAAVELWDYNREAADEANRVRDFLLLHYVAADRPKDAMWREVASAEMPESLAHTLRLFRERGRLPHYEEETFSRHSWLAVLIGQHVLPRRIDPLTDTVSEEQAERAMARQRETIAAMIPRLPPQGDYIRHLAAQVRQ